MYVITKSIRAIWNANNRVKDLNLGHHANFLRRYPLHHNLHNNVIYR